MSFAAQQQEVPGVQAQMDPVPDCSENSGSGKLTGKRAIITGGDSGIGRAVAIAVPVVGDGHRRRDLGDVRVGLGRDRPQRADGLIGAAVAVGGIKQVLLVRRKVHVVEALSKFATGSRRDHGPRDAQQVSA